MVDINSFKAALASFPSGVVIATTVDPCGVPKGFTASSFTSLSLEPPLVLLCLARSAQCHDTFCAAEYFAVSILGRKHEHIARRFASRGVEKFYPPRDFILKDNKLPIVAGAASSMICKNFGTHAGGDHTILVGEVEMADVAADSNPMIYLRRQILSVKIESGAI
jgi:flavin reductase ActVB